MNIEQQKYAQHTLNLLLIEDQSDDEYLILREFRKTNYEINNLRVQSEQELRQALQTDGWHIVISDFQMPHFSGLEALRIVRSIYPELPFIIASGAIGEETAVEIIRQGADDYLMKDNLERLVPIVERALREGETRKQRLQAEKQLEEMRLRLEGVIKSAMDAIVTADQDHKIVAFNVAAEKMFGYSAQEVLDTPLNLLMPPQFRKNHSKHIDHFSETSQTNRSMDSSGVLLGLRKSGESFPIEASISQIQVGGKKFFTAIIRDVTERAQAMRALADEKQRLELALKGGNLGLWEWIIPEKRIWVDERLLRVMGLESTDKSLQFKEWAHLIHPEDRKKVQLVLNELKQGNTRQKQFEFRAINYSGQWRWFIINGAIVELDKEGKTLRVLGNYLDITEERKAADQIKKMEFEMLNLKLKEQRTKSGEFLRGQEQERQRLAREFHDGIGQLLNVHKMQLSMGVGQQEALASVDEIIREVIRINNNLMPLVLQDFGLDPAIRQLVEMYRKISNAELYFFSDLQGKRLDPDLEAGIYRIVQEATSNAVKYAQASQISVQITQPEHQILIMIEDDGLGFDLSEKMSNLRKGFGLVNMQYRVEALNGQIEIDSKPGQGCLINIVLPLRS